MAVPCRENVLELWMDRVLRSYPSQSTEFLARERDQFRNPVGNTMRQGLDVLLDELMGAMDEARISAALDSIMQIRAIQGLEPSQAVEFLFQFKPILRRQLAGAELALVEDRIDELVLRGFDLFMRYRERTYRVKTNEARRRLFVLERRLAPNEVELEETH